MFVVPVRYHLLVGGFVVDRSGPLWLWARLLFHTFGDAFFVWLYRRYHQWVPFDDHLGDKSHFFRKTYDEVDGFGVSKVVVFCPCFEFTVVKHSDKQQFGCIPIDVVLVLDTGDDFSPSTAVLSEVWYAFTVAICLQHLQGNVWVTVRDIKRSPEAVQ